MKKMSKPKFLFKSKGSCLRRKLRNKDLKNEIGGMWSMIKEELRK